MLSDLGFSAMLKKRGKDYGIFDCVCGFCRCAVGNDFSGAEISGKDPTPLEVEMRLYEDDIDTAMIKQSEREKNEIDVD